MQCVLPVRSGSGLIDSGDYMKMILLILTLVLLSCEQANTPGAKLFLEPQDEEVLFNITPPEQTIESKFIWGTYYYVPLYDAVSGGYDILNTSGQRFGVELSLSDWCHGALEGSFQVQTLTGELKVFNFVKSVGLSKVNCSRYFSYNVGASRFMLSNSRYGNGVKTYKLVPYRSIAVDPKYISYGTVLYIPSAKGERINLDNGKSVTHDGYFFAADTGGAINGSHVDFFLGRNKINPFDWIRSRSSYRVKSFVVKDKNIVKYLTNLHL